MVMKNKGQMKIQQMAFMLKPRGFISRLDFLSLPPMKVITEHKCRGQMKIQQMAFMLIAVTLFFALVGMFVLVFGLSSLKKDASMLEEKNALLLVSKLANSPEFSCGEAFDYSQADCVDADKVMVLKRKYNDYKDFWGVYNVEVMKIYPAGQEDIECTEANYPRCGFIKVITGRNEGKRVSNFVLLCRKESKEGNVYDKCEIARLFVSYRDNEKK